MDSKPILHLSPAKEMKCSFLYYVQLLMIGWAGRWTQTPSTTAFQPKMWNALFFITFYIWCWPDWSMDLNLIHHPSPAKKMKSSFLGYVQLLMKSSLLMDSNPICNPSPANKMKCSFLDYIQLLMIGQAGRWTQTTSTTPLQPIKWNASFGFVFTSDDQPGWLLDSNPICHPSPAKKMKCSLLDYIHFGWSARLVNGLKPHSPPLSSQKHEMLIFGLCSTSDDQLGWSMDLNPICQPSPANKMKCYFLDYVQLLMISRAVRWTQTPSATSLQPIKWNAHFWITFNFWWLAGLVDGLKTHPPPLSSQRNEMLIFVLCSTSNDRLGWSMDSNPIHHCFSAKNVKCPFFHYILHLMLARLVNGLEPHPPPLSSQKKWNPHFWVMFNFWWLVRLFKEL